MKESQEATEGLTEEKTTRDLPLRLHDRLFANREKVEYLRIIHISYK